MSLESGRLGGGVEYMSLVTGHNCQILPRMTIIKQFIFASRHKYDNGDCDLAYI